MKSYTDLEQSKKLAEILPLESADMCYHFIEINKTPLCVPWERVHNDEKDNSLPAWSLAALLGVLPNASILLKGFDKIYDLTNSSGEIARADNPVDACYEMIIKLHELNLL